MQAAEATSIIANLNLVPDIVFPHRFVCELFESQTIARKE
jgi:hypothetical protein